jgi:hypothetical protein
MADRTSNPQTNVAPSAPWFVPLLLVAGLFLRLRLAWMTFLNPDEALHYFLAHQPSLALSYQASLTTAHPPLMVLFLHYWIWLGDSEFVLRFPFVIAGVLFCWTMFSWVERMSGRCAGLMTLALLLFSPPLISLSAEIRQYSLLLLFCSGCLYFLDRAFEEQSARWMALSMAALDLALLTHYSALIFAAAGGIYVLLRLLRRDLPVSATAVWIAGQASALAIGGLLFVTQISRLRSGGLPSEIASTWLRTSIFHSGEDHFSTFAVGKTVRLFRYLFSHGTIGVLALGLFLLAIILLLRQADSAQRKSAPRALALLFLSPFLIALAAGLAGIYPYGGTRHDVVLAVFAMPAVAIGLDRLDFSWLRVRAGWKGTKPLLLAIGLLICNFFQSPSGPYISPRNQNKKFMSEAMGFLNSAPPDSILFSDFQGSLVLNYYLCGKNSSVLFEASGPLHPSRCGNYNLIASAKTQQGFDRSAFPELLDEAWRLTPGEDKMWLFQTGWIDDNEHDWIADLRNLGCNAPRNFGPNILICPLDRKEP